MTDDRCGISVEGDEGHIRCSNRAIKHGLCDEHLMEIARADLDSLNRMRAGILARIFRDTFNEFMGLETRKPSDERTQSINVTGPGKPGHQIDGAGEKVLGQGPDTEGNPPKTSMEKAIDEGVCWLKANVYKGDGPP